MDIILVHLGGDAPGHLWDCVDQIRAVCDARISILLPTDTRRDLMPDNTYVWSVEGLGTTPAWTDFRKTNYFKDFGDLPLWGTACERFYVLEAFMEAMNIDKALHIEYDNLIYGAPDADWLDLVCGNGIGLTQITETLLSAGVMYIGSRRGIHRMNCMLNSLMAAGRDSLHAKYGPEMMHEMRMLDILSKEHQDDFTLLPTFPAEGSKYVYDCASWGQFVGGTHQHPGVSYHDDSHIVGRAINKCEYDLTWESREGLRIPVVTDNAYKSTPLFNLHIHSKELSKWNSKCQH